MVLFEPGRAPWCSTRGRSGANTNAESVAAVERLAAHQARAMAAADFAEGACRRRLALWLLQQPSDRHAAAAPTTARARLRPAALLARACALGDGEGCGVLGRLHFAPPRSSGVERSDERGVGLVIEGCRLGSPASCNALGDLFARGFAVRADVGRAAQCFERACAAPRSDGLAMACTKLGEMHRKGLGVPRDGLAAARLWSRGCALGDANACAAVAELLRATAGGREQGGREHAALREAVRGGASL